MRLFLNQLPTLRQENKPEKNIEPQRPIGLNTSKTVTNALQVGSNNEDSNPNPKSQTDQAQILDADIKKGIACYIVLVDISF